MSDNKSSRAEFHQFFLWEYQRRNKEYRKSYDCFIKLLSECGVNYSYLNISEFDPDKPNLFISKGQMQDDLLKENCEFYRKYGRYPTEYRTVEMKPKYLSSSESELEKIVTEHLLPSGMDSDTLLKKVLVEDIKGIEFTADRFKSLERGVMDFNYNLPYVDIRINLETKLDKLLAEISYIYYEYHSLEESNRNPLFPNYEALKNYEKLAEKYQQKIVEYEKNLTGRGKSQAILPRVVGLWLWDHWNEGRKKKKNQISDAIDAFFKEFATDDSCPHILHDGSKNSAYTEDKHLRKIFSITKNCIEKVKVLPMK
ncbi:MAG: hypothetical protein JRD05_06010 [Deltaproteobacteria bacterium]|nr:hypothetical protein [Deltaproteobacteria bacterium]